MRRLIVLCCILFLLVVTMSSAKMVFVQKHDDDISIYVMDDDGTGAMPLTDLLNPRAPKWSPDGKQIVFARGMSFQSPNIAIMNVDGSEIRDISIPDRRKMESHPSFSPDGKSIVFSRIDTIADENERYSVLVMDLESGKIKKISDLGISTPEFSPDGKHIVFSTISVAGVSGGNVWIMESDGDDPRPLLSPPPDSPLIISRYRPKWSPDGKHILYSEDHHTLTVLEKGIHYIPQGYYLFICDSRGKNIRKLNIPKTLRFSGHDWMDKGKSIVFCAREAVLKVVALAENFNEMNIYKYHIASGKHSLLYNELGNEYSVDWISDDVLSVSPKGKKKVTWGTLKK